MRAGCRMPGRDRLPRIMRGVVATGFALIVFGAVAAADTAGFATVGDKVITAAEFEAALQNTLRQKFYHRQVPDGKLQEYQREVADTLINRVLLLAESRRRGIEPDRARIDAEVAGYEKRYAQSPGWKKNRETMLPAVVRNLEERSLLDRLEAAVRETPAPAEAQLKAYYDGHRDLFTEPEQFKLSLILLKVDPSSPRATWDRAREEAAGIRKRLAGGADFGELARIHSTDASAERGGDMGYLHMGMIPEPLVAQMKEMRTGQISEPVTLLEGVAVFRFEERKVSRTRAFTEIRERAEQLWRRDEGERRWKELVGTLRQGATIRIDTARYPALAGLQPESKPAR